MVISGIWFCDKFVYPVGVLWRIKFDPQSFHKPYKPRVFMFGEIQSGIGMEELKVFFPGEKIETHDDSEPATDLFSAKVSVVESCLHLVVQGKCRFSFFNNRLSYAVFIPSDIPKYERAIAKVLGAKEIVRGEKYYLNKYVFLKTTKSNNYYFWKDERYRREGIVLLD